MFYACSAMFATVQRALAAGGAASSLGKSCASKENENERQEIGSAVVGRTCVRSLPGMGRSNSGFGFGELRSPGSLDGDQYQPCHKPALRPDHYRRKRR